MNPEDLYFKVYVTPVPESVYRCPRGPWSRGFFHAFYLTSDLRKSVWEKGYMEFENNNIYLNYLLCVIYVEFLLTKENVRILGLWRNL